MTQPIIADLGKTTASELKVIERYKNSEVTKLLYVTRSRGNHLLVYYDRVYIRKTKKHEVPFKYCCVGFDKWGRRRFRKAGNIWSKRFNDIIDDFSKTNY